MSDIIFDPFSFEFDEDEPFAWEYEPNVDPEPEPIQILTFPDFPKYQPLLPLSK